MTNEVSVTLTVEEREAIRSVKRLEDSIEKLSKNSQNSFKRVDNSVSTFKGTLGAILASNVVGKIGNGLFSLAKGSLDAAANVERLKTQFQILTGSQEKASKLFQQLTDFSAKTPFQLNDIADASAKLISFGFNAENVTSKIEKIGQVAAGSNSDLKEVALIYGQIAAAGKLTGERLLQLQERAVPIGSALAKTLGVAENRVRDLVSQGVVGFKEFEQAFNSLSGEGGIFAGAIEKQSKTINGSLSTLRDNFDILKSRLGEAFAPEVIKSISSITIALQDLTTTVVDNRDAFKSVIGFIGDYVTVYTNLAAQVIKSKTPIDEVNDKILETSDRIDELKKLRDREGAVGFISGILRPAKQEQELLQDLENQQAELKRLILERNKLVKESARTAQDQVKPDDTVVKNIETQNQTIIDGRRKLNDELKQLEQDRLITQSEAAIFQAEFDTQRQVEEIKKIKDFENAKAQAKYDAAIEANKLIQDLETRQIANDKASTEKRIAQAKAEQKANATIRNIELADRNAFFNSAISLSNSKNKTLATIGKLAGLTQIAQATPPAVASSFNYGTRIGGPPLGFTFAGIALAAQLKQAAELRNAGNFATGGFVGGSSYSGDKLTANVNSGEAILNTRQQRNFMDLANSGINADNAVFDLLEEMKVLSGAVMSQPIVVQVNGREIARTVRDERRAGFEI